MFLFFFDMDCGHTLTQPKVMKDCFTVHVINGNIETENQAHLIAVRFKVTNDNQTS